MIFFSDKTQILTMRGGEMPCEVLSSWETIGKKKSEPLGFSSFYFIFFLLVLFLIRVTQVS